MLKVNIKIIKKEQKKRQSFFKIFGSLLLFLSSISILKPEPALAQIIINKNIYEQPLIIEGISGGVMTATDITKTKNTATGYCNGFVSSQPNHILNIESFFQSLGLKVASSADTTIMVRGPGGVWCNDDTHNANPMIQGAWQPGIYEIWVGSYKVNSNNNYQIIITGIE